MNPAEFNALLEERFQIMRDSLASKAAEYAPDEDRLHNFRSAAGLERSSLSAALWGMNVKHIVSLTDMVKNPSRYTRDQWAEKIKDYMNYGVLLEACVVDDTGTLSLHP